MVLTSYEMNPEYINLTGRDPNQQQGTATENSLYESSDATDEGEEEGSCSNSSTCHIRDCNEEITDSSLMQVTSSRESNGYFYQNVETPLGSSEEYVAIQQINTEDLFPYNLDLGDILKENCSADQINLEQEGDHLPTLEEHDSANLNFELNLNPHTSAAKNNWYYSSVLEKVFIKLDKTFYIEVLYRYNPQLIPKNIRCMIVYSDGISEKVARCNNHLATDTSKNDIEKHSVMRSDNENISYKGNIEGKNVKDRLSVLIPLSCVQPNEHNIVKQSISLKFVCQNSCTGRRQTAVIFTLESESNQVLGKRVMNVKVCSCPKRDKNKDEEKHNLKRTANSAGLSNSDPPGKRPSKIKIKEESCCEDELGQIFAPPSQVQSNLVSQGQSSNLNASFTQRSDGTVSLTFDVPNLVAAQITALNAYSTIAGQMADDPLNSNKYIRHLKDLNSLRKDLNKAEKM